MSVAERPDMVIDFGDLFKRSARRSIS